MAKEKIALVVDSTCGYSKKEAEKMGMFYVPVILTIDGKDFNDGVDVVEKDFVHMTYSEAVDQLSKAKESFDYPVEWGIDLQSEHERYLTEKLYKCPVIVTDYPASIKPFYMRLSDDGKTVAAMDILVPGIGEIVGGSQREERLDVLSRRMTDAGIDLEEYDWYLDLRRYGTVPHTGFGLGFERLVQFATGMSNIREVIAFPRTPGFAPC